MFTQGCLPGAQEKLLPDSLSLLLPLKTTSPTKDQFQGIISATVGSDIRASTLMFTTRAKHLKVTTNSIFIRLLG